MSSKKTDRREFLPLLIACINNQNYDKSKLEWVILDDGEDKNLNLIANKLVNAFLKNKICIPAIMKSKDTNLWRGI